MLVPAAVAAGVASVAAILAQGAAELLEVRMGALLRRGQLVEFLLLGGLAALFALAGTEAVCAWLYTQILNIPYHGQGLAWLWLPLLAALVLALPGMWLLRRTVHVAPLRVLRELVD